MRIGANDLHTEIIHALYDSERNSFSFVAVFVTRIAWYTQYLWFLGVQLSAASTKKAIKRRFYAYNRKLLTF